MAEYNYKVEGIYETDKGSGKELTSFNFTIKLSRFKEQGAGTHILRRFLPICIKNQKKTPLLSEIKHWLITDIQKVSDEFPLVGKEINKMNEQEIQELACMYDLYEIPLPNTTSITELREKAEQAYMQRILKIPMDTIDEQKKLSFFKEQSDGSLKFDLGDEILKVELIENFVGKKIEEKKKTLSDFLHTKNENTTNFVQNIPNNNDIKQSNMSNGLFPSAEELTQGQN